MVLLGDLIALRQIGIVVMLPIELNSRVDIASQSERSLNSEIQALLIQNRKHSGQGYIYEVCLCVSLLELRALRA